METPWHNESCKFEATHQIDRPLENDPCGRNAFVLLSLLPLSSSSGQQMQHSEHEDEFRKEQLDPMKLVARGEKGRAVRRGTNIPFHC